MNSQILTLVHFIHCQILYHFYNHSYATKPTLNRNLFYFWYDIKDLSLRRIGLLFVGNETLEFAFLNHKQRYYCKYLCLGTNYIYKEDKRTITSAEISFKFVFLIYYLKIRIIRNFSVVKHFVVFCHRNVNFLLTAVDLFL